MRVIKSPIQIQKISLNHKNTCSVEHDNVILTKVYLLNSDYIKLKNIDSKKTSIVSELKSHKDITTFIQKQIKINPKKETVA